MNKNDIIFSIFCGLAVSWIAIDFFGKIGLIFVILLPILAVIGLWLVEFVGMRFVFLHQAGKFALVGAFADVIDIKVFQLLFIFAPFSISFKAISFLIATGIKYWANKYWAFEQHINENRGREVAYFLFTTSVGLSLNVVSFYYFGKIEIGLPVKIWQELSIIFAALVAAIWNFCGYKFLVFKK